MLFNQKNKQLSGVLKINFFKLKEIVLNVIMKCRYKIVQLIKKKKDGAVITVNINKVLEVNHSLIILKK